MATKTKAQLEDQIRKMQGTIARLSQERDDAVMRAAAAELAAAGELPNLPTDRYAFNARQRIDAAAMAQFDRLVKWAARNHGYRAGSAPEEHEAAGIGWLMSTHWRSWGTPILLAAFVGLEDCNWRTEAGIALRMYERLTSAERNRAGNVPDYSDIGIEPEPRRR